MHSPEYPVQSRKEKVPVNIRNGYRCYAMIKNNEVIADIWYVNGSASSSTPIQKYLDRFGIELDSSQAYLFDMCMAPDERGKGMAAFCMGSVLNAVKGRGIVKVYGYFDARNISALWVHRLLKYRELRRVTLRKILLFETANPHIGRA